MDWMDRERNIWVVGGDLRQRALARLLREDGHTVHIAALEGEGLAPEPLGPGLALARKRSPCPRCWITWRRDRSSAGVWCPRR